MSARDRLSAAMRGFAGQDTDGRRLFQSPARVNIIGEHTDYNDGLVLPTTTAIYTWLAVTARNDRQLEIRSANLDASGSASLDDLAPGTNVDWMEYVKGVAALLEADGVVLTGADILIDSDIPLGAGLSSSASLELAVAAALLAVAGDSLPAARVAEICQQAEQEYARVQCGIMDQYTIACAEKGHAILLDCRSREASQVAIPANIGFVITDSGVQHRLPDGNYNCRRDECVAAAEVLHGAGISSLRELDRQALEHERGALGDVLYRRCRHVVSENKRVQQAAMALEEGDVDVLGELVCASHASLRDDFEVSCEELDTLVEVANDCDGVSGSRMIGAGFGGCVLSVADAKNLHAASDQIRRRYGERTGGEPWTHIVEAAHPVREVYVA